MTAGDLRRLVDEFLADRVPVKQFCEEYETGFNFELDRTSADDQELELLQSLFDEVVLFSPHEDDRRRYPGYRDEAQIRRAALAFTNRLARNE